jgi:HEAT repeat protein
VELGGAGAEALAESLRNPELSKGSSDIAIAALVSMGQRGIRLLTDALSDPTTRARAEAALVKIGAPAVEALVNGLHGSRYGSEIAECLGKIGAPAVEPLIQALESYPSFGSDDFHNQVANALGHVGGSRAVEKLIYTLDHFSPKVHDEAVRGLGRIGDPRARGSLLRALGNQEATLSKDFISLTNCGGWAIREPTKYSLNN